MQNADRKILVLWVIAIALITRDELASGEFMPRPSRYVGSAMVYGVAAVIAEFAADLAFWLAFGWTLAIAYQMLYGSPRRRMLAPAPAAPSMPGIAQRR